MWKNRYFKKKDKAFMGPVEYIIAGLGNPGSRYENTRHNVGFRAADLLAVRHGIRVKDLKFRAVYGLGHICDKRAAILKPQTFMNLSGEAVRDCAAFFKLPMERVIVIYDDVSLEPGRLRVRDKGSAGGHNGIKDILYKCGTDGFPRVKIGVGAPPHKDYDLADWVLSPFAKKENEVIAQMIDRAADAVEEIIREGPDAAANRYNN